MPKGSDKAIDVASSPIAQDYVELPFDVDAGIGSRARIGMVVLASDHTIEHEFHHAVGLPGIALYTSRIPNSPLITPETLSAMETEIAARAAIILPGMDLDVIAYCCTSATMVLGEHTVFARLQEGRPKARPTTPVTAVFAALDTLRIRRVAVLTPYSAPVNAVVRRTILERGYDVPVFGSFNEPDDNMAGRITVDSIRRAVLALGARDDVDGVFLSCTNLRLVDIVRDLELELGKPVTSSNHALAWHCLRLAGVDDHLPQWGMLFER